MSFTTSHLFATRVPMVDGVTRKALCDAEIHDAVAVALLDGELVVTLPKGLCQECARIQLSGPKKKRSLYLLYQITSGELAEKMKVGATVE